MAPAHGTLLISGSGTEDPDREWAPAVCAGRVGGLLVIPAGDGHRCLEPEIGAGVATVFVDRPAGRTGAESSWRTAGRARAGASPT
ncbi:hypothetical protein EF903_13330 [Streptomyces sp. WAC05292]|uniref:hypothetical protein n=1 Tax=Streptomyces sp. WAC05292 TaxID=2487418 RepID=UPI000F737649|nr:hypothetical protein EF903_13330 [Streptomyces sp. WAC05292]